ncbi:MAG: SDR family NAD(P)-dependent oxidoreductase [Chloroflexi bacterium]|nr:SDR family NAD(P)-dependent oxidoreductase [Chloroflexota bacterium]
MVTPRLTGKVAIVTGAASGIGRASAIRFAREGATVVIADINASGGDESADLIRQEGGESSFIRCDVSDTKDVQALVDETQSTHGHIDILFANAAYLDELFAIAETSEEVWDRHIGVTLTGVYLCCRYVIPHMIEAGAGSILATSSVGGSVAFDRQAAYCTAKAGVEMLMKTIARDYGRAGIRANAIAPGAVYTPVMEDVKRRNPDGWDQVLRDMSLLERLWAEPEDIAAAAAYLVSDEAAFVTGTVLTVDGGWTAH